MTKKPIKITSIPYPMDSSHSLLSPEELEFSLMGEYEILKKIEQISDALIRVLEVIGCPGGISKVQNISLTLVVQEEIVKHLYTTYCEVFRIHQRLSKLLASEYFDETNQEIIRNRAEEIVNDQLYLIQREVFFKIVNAKEVAEGEKNEDGPALLFPAIEKVKNSIIHKIRQQTAELYTIAVDTCKKFRGIADSYVELEQVQLDERAKYDSISQTFEQEKKVRIEHIIDMSPSKLGDTAYLDTLIDLFEQLRNVYRRKTESLNDLNASAVSNYPQKIALLETGCENVDKRLRPLLVLKNMALQFPAIEKQLDFFADSHYQARAVMNVLKDVKAEIGHLFSKYNLESFTVISFLKYKLNGISHMYESIHYYYAVMQIEKDMRMALTKRYAQPDSEDVEEAVGQKMETIGITGIVQSIHHWIASMNFKNYEIHLAFLQYKIKPDLKELKTSIKTRTLNINSLYARVIKEYKAAQKIFAGFLIEDLGATDIDSQFSTQLTANRDFPEAVSVTKGFNIMLATKRKTVTMLEKNLLERFDDQVDLNRISEMAILKVKKDFLRELLKEIQEYSHVQDIFLELLKEFIKLQDDQSNRIDDTSIILEIEQLAGGTFDKFKNEKLQAFRRFFNRSNLTKRDLTVAYMAANITPQEIESFSRLLPALPRNELQLDSIYGRLLLDIKSLYQENLRNKASSAYHLVERVYEKREHMKLLANINAFLQICAEPFFTKIEKEEKRTNHLIFLQRTKYRKELNEIIRYWQFLIKEQIDPGQGQRGRFRRYTEDEKKWMMTYISPDQLHLVDRQLESSLDLEVSGKLQEVENFILEVVSGLFQLFKEDRRVLSPFESFEKGTKIHSRDLQHQEDLDLQTDKNYVPNIRRRLQTTEALT